MAEIYVLVINHQYGPNLYVSHNQEQLQRKVIKFAQENWDESPCGDRPFWLEEVDEYVEKWESFSYDIQSVEVLE